MIKITLYNFLLVMVLAFLFSCAPAKSQSSSSDSSKGSNKYEEDLSSVRPKYEEKDSSTPETQVKNKVAVTPQNDVTKKLNEKLDTLAKTNGANKYTQGFRILVYSGKSSQDVQQAKTKVYEVVPNTSIYIDFKSPNQRVKVGDCLDRVEAYSLHGKLKKQFPNAVIIPDQVVITAR
jgi:hypothetical protein